MTVEWIGKSSRNGGISTICLCLDGSILHLKVGAFFWSHQWLLKVLGCCYYWKMAVLWAWCELCVWTSSENVIKIQTVSELCCIVQLSECKK